MGEGGGINDGVKNVQESAYFWLLVWLLVNL